MARRPLCSNNMHKFSCSFYLEKYQNMKSMEVRSSRRSRPMVSDPAREIANERAWNVSMFIMYILWSNLFTPSFYFILRKFYKDFGTVRVGGGTFRSYPKTTNLCGYWVKKSPLVVIVGPKQFLDTMMRTRMYVFFVTWLTKKCLYPRYISNFFFYYYLLLVNWLWQLKKLFGNNPENKL